MSKVHTVLDLVFKTGKEYNVLDIVDFANTSELSKGCLDLTQQLFTNKKIPDVHELINLFPDETDANIFLPWYHESLIKEGYWVTCQVVRYLLCGINI